MKANRTPFEILGVTPADDMTTIRMAWRAKVRVLHPDVAGNTAQATERLAEINAAFDALQGHKPSAASRAARAADVEREARAARRAAKEAKRQRDVLRRRAEAARAERQASETKRAMDSARKAMLARHRGTLHAKAANAYASACKITAA